MSVFSTFVEAWSKTTQMKLTATNINTSGPLQSSADKAAFVMDPYPLMPVARMNPGPDLPWRLDCKSLHRLPLLSPAPLSISVLLQRCL